MKALADDVVDYLVDGQARGWRDTTIQSYRYLLGLALPVLAERDCRRSADITPDDLVAVMSAALQAGRARKTRVQLAVLLKQYLAWLTTTRRIATDPGPTLPIPQDGDDPLPEPPLTEAEVRACFAAMPRRTGLDLRNIAILGLLYDAALRCGEVVALNVSDLNLRAPEAIIRNGKGGQDRIAVLHDTGTADLRDWLALRRQYLRGPDHGALFLNQYGQRISTNVIYGVCDLLNDLGVAVGRRIHPHLFRHTLAVHLHRGKVSIRHIQDALGHASIESTRIYMRMTPGRLKEEYDAAMPDIALDLPPRPVPGSPPGATR